MWDEWHIGTFRVVRGLRPHCCCENPGPKRKDSSLYSLSWQDTPRSFTDLKKSSIEKTQGTEEHGPSANVFADFRRIISVLLIYEIVLFRQDSVPSRSGTPDRTLFLSGENQVPSGGRDLLRLIRNSTMSKGLQAPNLKNALSVPPASRPKDSRNGAGCTSGFAGGCRPDAGAPRKTSCP